MTELNREDFSQYPIIGDCIRAVQYQSGRMAGVMPFLFTWAIVADFTLSGYEERWCYKTLVEAMGALEDWDGEGEPNGWHRHPTTGRRRDEHGNDIGAW